MQKYGDFSKISTEYSNGRTSFNQNVIDYICSELENSTKVKILDIGCGTGIATKQLKTQLPMSEIFATDISNEMVDIARIHNEHITFHVAAVNNQPFVSDMFDIITAFSSFHWFCDKESILEIQRILKSDGKFIIINKNEVGYLKKGAVHIIRRYITNSIPDTKINYNPMQILENNGFIKISEYRFPNEEILTISGALLYFQSISLWSYVPNNLKETVITELYKYLESFNGPIKRVLDTKIVIGFYKK